MPYTMKQFRWAHTTEGRKKLGDAIVREWERIVKEKGLEKKKRKKGGKKRG